MASGKHSAFLRRTHARATAFSLPQGWPLCVPKTGRLGDDRLAESGIGLYVVKPDPPVATDLASQT